MNNLEKLKKALKKERIIKKEEKPRELKIENLEPGDKIEVIANHCSHQYATGDILTIKNIDKNQDIYVEENTWYVQINDIKFPNTIISSSPTTTLNTSPCENIIKIGKEITQLRTINNMTKKELAKKINMSSTTIGRLEKGYCYNAYTIAKTALAFNKTLTIK